MNTHPPEDLFDLMSRWDIEAKEIPAYLLRQGAALSASDRNNLLVRRAVLIRLVKELRDTMAGMAVRYRGVVNGQVWIEADTEEECWAKVKDQGTVEFRLCSHWVLTDSAIEHQK
jgi:hypothetical protein